VIKVDQVTVTPRDQRVLNLLTQGCCNKDSGGELYTGPLTV
jgi:DNA-binding NarL/FixJ family response regulator